jgi:hypothetical protein
LETLCGAAANLCEKVLRSVQVQKWNGSHAASTVWHAGHACKHAQNM